jgi:hypothetical protein
MGRERQLLLHQRIPGFEVFFPQRERKRERDEENEAGLEDERRVIEG